MMCRNASGLRGVHTLTLALFLVGCAGGISVQTTVQEDGTVIDRVVGNEIGIEGEGEYSDYAIHGSTMDFVGVDQYCYLDPSKHRAADGVVTYYLEFSYTGPRELYIERRKSLELVIDRLYSVVLVGQGEITRDQEKMNNTFVESFSYLITANELVKLAEAKQVQVVVTGREFALTGFFTKNNIDNFEGFVRDYVE